MRKRWLLGLVIAIIYFWESNQTIAYSSTDWGDQFITNVNLGDAQCARRTSFGLYDKMVGEWEFKIPAGTPVKPDDRLTFTLPQNLRLVSNAQFNLKDRRGKVIGRVNAQRGSGKVTLRLAHYVTQHPGGIYGNVKLGLLWNYEQVKPGTNVTVNWPHFRAATYQVLPQRGPNSHETVYSWGWYDTKDPQLIHWRVRVNYAKRPLRQVTYTDMLGVNQLLVPGSVKVQKVKFNRNGRNFKVLASRSPKSVTQYSQLRFAVSLGDLDGANLIDFETRSTSSTAQCFKHQAQLTGVNLNQKATGATPVKQASGTGSELGSAQGARLRDADARQPLPLRLDTILAGDDHHLVAKFGLVTLGLVACVGWFVYRRPPR
ncbi:collagen binding domain-containing protein [Pediococcus acidilactici]